MATVTTTKKAVNKYNKTFAGSSEIIVLNSKNANALLTKLLYTATMKAWTERARLRRAVSKFTRSLEAGTCKAVVVNYGKRKEVSDLVLFSSLESLGAGVSEANNAAERAATTATATATTRKSKKKACTKKSK